MTAMRTAIIAGQGRLPRALADAMTDVPLVAALDGFTPDGLTVDLRFRVERLVPFLRALERDGIRQVIFAGGVTRPRLDPALLDEATAGLLPRLMQAMAAGDDATLRVVIELFEEFGFSVIGVEDLAPALLPGAGVLAGTVTPRDEADAARAARIVAALGAEDVGQGAVVVQGLCLGVEALPGTDALLAQVAGIVGLRPDPARGRGVFYKAAKPGQDRRIDLPTIGPDTLRGVAAAGLGGLAFQAGSVICLDLDEMQGLAGELGLFLWARG
ncbi:MAG: UDP-2,3-diacylglucosamine diphosphatase LpxI [Tabrizicola sp.]|uniref:LpxI family protein n=1 Tax=Tabrizicola sp. TaxID=2005166 RepID=UPI002ABC8D45|nr:UDP-2,3-diacylglucosamine diphosphatase LpxI [Tabrizicola sp.]MDZ4086126.1 UDP-2,3-diacylglucosamine diphosphatase LpxI [Tabrizicola sp.]